MQRHPALYFGESPISGRGVFCAEDLAEGDLLEICPVIVLSPEDRQKIHTTHLHDFYFSWNENEQSAAIALGFGSLFNHSSEPNVGYEMDYEGRMIQFYMINAVAAGEELFIDYTQGDREGLWF